MNQLSWLLYWAGVLGNLGPVLIFLGLPTIIGGAFLVVNGFTYEKYYNYEQERDEPIRRRFMFWGVPCVAFGLILCVLAAFVPSSDTVYAIAASQVGEQALKLPVITKAEQALEAWLDKQIASK